MRPQVLIDGRAAIRSEIGGVERWARELSVRLPALKPERYRVALPPRIFAHRVGHLWEQSVLPIRAGLKVVLCPANLAPIFARRTVVVIHDVAPLRQPDWYSPAYVRWQRALLPQIARRALAVITPSAFSAAEIGDLLAVPPQRITVIAGGVDARFRSDADPAPARATLGLGRPYVLTVGSRTARKNIAALKPCAAMLSGRGIELVAVGGDRPQYRSEGEIANVRALGPVADALLPGLYAGAQAFVLPSLYEGFGLTALEALASGVPVVASDRAALPEVCGEAAILVDPADPAAIAAAVAAAIDYPQRWRAVGPQRAAPYTWDFTAAAVDRLLSELLA